jgi:hypothetical protein
VDDFGRLIDMVIAAQDFGLERREARAVAQAALDRSGEATDSLDAVAAALAERVVANARLKLSTSA